MLRRLILLFLCIHPGYAKPKVVAHENQVDSNAVVAFTALLTTPTDFTGNVVIPYDDAIVNEGGRYSEISGQFGCIDDDFYVFIWSQRKDSDSVYGTRCITKLRKGGEDYKYGPKTNYYTIGQSGSSQTTAVLQCSTDVPTAITVMTVPWSEDVGSTARFFYMETRFTGFRLQAPIAFTVELSDDQHISEGGRLRFKTEVANFGGHYDLINDFFRCPDNGVYVFSVTTHTPTPTTWSVSRLMMDGNVVLQGPITYIATDDYDVDSGSDSITAVVRCDEGSSLYVEAQAAYHFPQNSYGAELTSFTGYKLYDAIPGAVAFTAVTSTNQTGAAGQPLILDSVITNIGDAYNIGLNAFVCLDNDLYLFTWSGTEVKTGASVSHLHLYMDDTHVDGFALTRQSAADESSTSGTGTLSAIRKCNVGARFQVRVRETVSGRVFIGGYCTFSAYKVPGAWAKKSD